MFGFIVENGYVVTFIHRQFLLYFFYILKKDMKKLKD